MARRGSAFSVLCCVPNCADRYPLLLDAIEDDIRSATDDQLADAWLGSGAAEVRMILQRFHEGDDSRGEAFSCVGLVDCDVGANLLQARACEGRPKDFYRHSSSSSCFLPQAHFGGADSWFVPQERSQAFMSSCLM
jgi:hypothetical protein